MAYSELIKSFGRIRTYMRSFYVYGFKHRGEFDEKSARAYDNERRRIESWLGDYMSFGQDEDGRRVFLSVDSRAVSSNPLYRAFLTKSFTDRDIMLHFQLLDILPETDGLPIFEIMEAPPELSAQMREFQRHVWGVASAQKDTLEHLEMTVYVGPDEDFIVQRLKREKRAGTVERLDETHWRFSIDVYDTLEMMPWIRSFIGRITAFEADNPVVRSRFYHDLEAMSGLYGG
jgi:hypothetical protein